MSKRRHYTAKAAKRSTPIVIGVPWAIRGPCYLCAAALVTLYGWGAFHAYPWPFAAALTGVFVLGELLKPKLGEMIGEAIDLRSHIGWLLLIACGAAISVGAFGGHGAIAAANRPAERHALLLQDLATAQDAYDSAQTRVDAIPTCTPDMPRVRCIAQTEQNAERLSEARRIRDRAEERRDLARAAVDNSPGKGAVGIPEHIAALAPIGALFIEFLLFVVPMAYVLLRRRREAQERPAPVEPVRKMQEVSDKPAPLSARELALKGWTGEKGEARRRAMQARQQRKYQRA